MIRGLVLLALGSSTAAAQSLDQRIARAPDGDVWLSYAARPGVYGNGWNGVTLSDVDRDSWRSTCDSGPVRVSLTKRGSDVIRLRAYVGSTWPAAAGVADLGTVSAPEAAHYLLSLARTATSGAGDRAVFAATLADSVTLWPDLLRMARDAGVPRRVRRTAVFWLGQAAEEAATRGLDDLVSADSMDREVRAAAVFALSQRPREEGVPALIRVARSHRDPEVRRKAIFWLGQSDDSRALALFEELLTRP